MSEDNSPKEGFSDQEELIQTNRENQEEYKNQINTLLIMEEYEKALNTIFDPYQNICESNEEEIIHPIIYNVLSFLMIIKVLKTGLKKKKKLILI